MGTEGHRKTVTLRLTPTGNGPVFRGGQALNPYLPSSRLSWRFLPALTLLAVLFCLGSCCLSLQFLPVLAVIAYPGFLASRENDGQGGQGGSHAPLLRVAPQSLLSQASRETRLTGTKGPSGGQVACAATRSESAQSRPPERPALLRPAVLRFRVACWRYGTREAIEMIVCLVIPD